MWFFKKKGDLAFEESLGDDWARDLGVTESPLNSRVLFFLGLTILGVGLAVTGRILLLARDHDFYGARALSNLSQTQKIPAPRGIITDIKGKVLVENKPVFLALLKVRDFFQIKALQAETVRAVYNILGMGEEEFWKLVEENKEGMLGDAVVLSNDLDQDQLIKLESRQLPTLLVSRGFKRQYALGPVFAPILGYTGLVSAEDLKQYPQLGGRDFVGKAGVEVFYDQVLRGKDGLSVKIRDARGNVLEKEEDRPPEAGRELRLTLDADFQEYFYERLKNGLQSLGRSVGVGIAIDPRDGRILALVNIPSFDNNLFNLAANHQEIKVLLSSPSRPLFNRAVAGLYAPGSTIKPLHAVAALEEKVVTRESQIFSPGYLDVPNPFIPGEVTRFLDWRRQGSVNLASAIAKSSNVYFYLVGGGSPLGATTGQDGIKGLGINRLREWWQKFGLGKTLGVDLPTEAAGFLPSIESKEKRTGKPWLLGDTYNVSIGQGDLLITPLQLISYIGAIANGGKVYRPYLAFDFNQPTVIYDLTVSSPSIREAQKGMAQAVTSPLGTAHLLDDLPFPVAAKTGSAQVRDKKEENAFFVGYASRPKVSKEENQPEPEIAILVLVENAREGSLNALPIAKDVLDWYYVNRISSVLNKER